MSKDFSALISTLQELNQFQKKSDLPELQSMEELEQDYVKFTQDSKALKLHFEKWLPSFKNKLRPMVPGEVCTILAATGIGKTTILHNIAFNIAPLKTIIFEIELPGTLTFERFISLQTQTEGDVIESTYERGSKINWKQSALSHIFTCSQSRLGIEDIERIIKNAHTKIGERPAVVMIDYIGLIAGKGNSRYEKMSMVAEEIKKVAKECQVAIVMACQIPRKKPDDSEEVFLHDAKDSGSIENSSGIVLGAWREGKGGSEMKVKILKQTKGRGVGQIIDCHFKGETSLIKENFHINEQKALI